MSEKGIQFGETALGTADGIRVLSGDGNAAGLTFGIVVSRFNAELTGHLREAAVQVLLSRGAKRSGIRVVQVPGAYEIPLVADRLAASGGFHAILCLGCVIQGETPHAGLINQAVAGALSDISRRHGIPVIDSVVSANTMDQAVARCRPGPSCRGAYAAEAAVEMARLMQVLKEEGL